jgi:hypothetical protein
MGLKERAQAAALVVKGRVLLYKELPASAIRLQKWAALIAEAAKKKDGQASFSGDAALRRAEDYNAQLEKMSTFIKRVALLKDDGEKIKQFIQDMKKSENLADKAFKSYRFAKDRFWDEFGRGSWDDQFVRWFSSDKPNWELLKRALNGFVTIDVNVL